MTPMIALSRTHGNESIDKGVAHAFTVCYFQISLGKVSSVHMCDGQKKPRSE